MEKISLSQFLYFQPNAPIEQPTDKGFLMLANRLIKIWCESKLMKDVPNPLKQLVALGLVGYYQDIIADSGVWRTFISECKRMYGRYVPFYIDSEDYIEYELNCNDVKFLTWYFLAFNSMQYRQLYPLDADLIALAELFYKELDKCYESSPNPSDYTIIFDVELYDEEYIQPVYDLSQWLFWKNYLIVPPFQLTYAQVYNEMEEIRVSGISEKEALEKCETIKNEVMSSIPTGPLALYLNEWLHLILTGKYPKQSSAKNKVANGNHPYYDAFVKATNGEKILFIETYEELNKFFIEGMNWQEGEEHLPIMKSHSDFVLMVTPDKGMLVAKNVAKCIKHPKNHLYNKEYADENAFQLIARRGLCPADLLLFVCENGFLPDAKFPYSENTELVKDNWDFLARCYLQEYYRAD